MATVTYTRLWNLGNFENEKIEITDETQPGETVDAAYLRVRAWVYEAAGVRDPMAPAPLPPVVALNVIGTGPRPGDDKADDDDDIDNHDFGL